MCGIAGVKINLHNKAVDRNILLNRMLDSMVSRGPDNKDFYSDEEVGLGHCRLKIVDLTSQGNQPMSNEDRSLWIVHNGEIYNFKELKKELESFGHVFRSQSDTEVILHSYEEWGMACLDKLRGMFAFCIWDKGKKELFIARDRLGIKPLYYYNKGLFIFASQVRAILNTGIVLKKISSFGLASYFAYGGIKDPWAMVEDVHSLLPGHYMIYSDSKLKIVNYWDISNFSSPNPGIKLQEAAERVNLIMHENMRLHLFSDVPLGIFLSGGIDSSSLLSFMARESPNIRSLSLIFREKELDEGCYSRAIAKIYNTEHREIMISHNDILGELPNAISAMDEPTFNGINTFFIAKAAKEAGLKVAISGLGGDEVFCGYPKFRRIPKLIWLSKIRNKIPRLASKVVLPYVLRMMIPPLPQKRKILALINGDYSAVEDYYFCLRLLFTADEQKRLLKAEVSQVPKEKRITGSCSDIINMISWLEMTNYMRDILLRDTDFMSMAHSLEVRVPFLDHKLIEFVISLPGRIKMDNRFNKPLLFKSLDKPLPYALIRREKMGFVLPFASWMRGALRKEIEYTLEEKNSVLDNFIEDTEVIRIWQSFLKGHLSWQRPWSLYVLKKWTKIYLQ